MAERQRPPSRRQAYRLKFKWVSPSENVFTFFLTVSYFGTYDSPDFRRPAELFLDVSKPLSELAYQVAQEAIYASMLLQYGAPLDEIVDGSLRVFAGTPMERPATAIGYALSLIRDGKVLPEGFEGYALAGAESLRLRLIAPEPLPEPPEPPAAA